MKPIHILNSTLVPMSICIAISLAPQTAFAGDTEDALIDKVVMAYGGAKLLNMKSITIDTTERDRWPGQNFAGQEDTLSHARHVLTLDPKNQRALNERWGTDKGSTFHYGDVVDGDTSYQISFPVKTYSMSEEGGYYGALGGYMRGSDTMLAYELKRHEDTAKYGGIANYYGRPHAKITFDFPQSPPVTLYVDQASGLISKMTRKPADDPLTYAFDNHKTHKGIRYASDYAFFLGDHLASFTTRRSITINRAKARDFKLDKSLTLEPESILESEDPIIAAIGNTSHFVGVNGAYGLFTDAGDHIISIGGYAGLKDRFDAYQKAAGHNKPLRYQIVTHHHTDHLDGMADAFKLGAIFVTPETAVANLREAAGNDIPENRMRVIKDMTTLGPVKIHLVATNHAFENAIAYVPDGKAVYEADHYGGQYKDAISPAYANAKSMHAALVGLGLDIDVMLNTHSQKLVSWEEFEKAVAAYNSDKCVSRRKICR